MAIFKYLSALTVALLLSVAPAAYAQSAPPNRINYSGVIYRLVWQSHPTPNYSKYEYLPEGQQLPYYQNMLMLETITGTGYRAIDPRQCPLPANSGGNLTVNVSACAQIQFLKQRKLVDPITHYEVIQNKRLGEVLLDFIVSAEDAEVGTIIEWNGYRYIPIDNGVLLYAQSIRAYGERDGLSFLNSLGQMRQQWISALISARVPPFTF